VVASWAFLRLKHGGRQCWVVTRKIQMSSPNTTERKFLTRSNTVSERKETMNLPSDGTSSKNLNPFTRALAPPFIGRRRTFTFPKCPRAHRIFLMWTHTRMSFHPTYLQARHQFTLKTRTFWDDNFDFASSPVCEFLRAWLPNQTPDRFPN
jgi:hypothetical protein